VGPSWRNIGIIVLIALAVWLIPGGGTAASVVGEFISIAFLVAIWFALVYVYRNFRTTIFTLGERYRGFLYAGLAAILFLGASADRFFDEAATTLVWFAILGAAVYALVATFRHWREYV
jgi:hypothetical protein